MLDIIWEGSVFINHSLSIVNRKIIIELLKDPEINISIRQNEDDVVKDSLLKSEQDDISKNINKSPKGAPVSLKTNKKLDKVDYVIRHKWPPDFSKPEQGQLIIMQPWEVGSMPKDWLEPFLTVVDQIWVPSNANKEIYLRDGVPEEKVKVIPLGIDKKNISNLNSLHSNIFKTDKKFKFLFNGGTIHRKGIDLLLKAYTEEFSKDEDVALIIKDIGISNIYVENYKNEIIELKDNSNNPEIIYIDKNLSEQELESLYKSSDCYVHPYRGEGFGMPIIEAMSNALPVIVTGFGSSLDFSNEEFCYLLDFDIHKPESNFYFDVETVNSPFYPEVKISDLRKKMRYVFENKKNRIEKGKKAQKFILNNFTWEKTANIVIDILKESVNNNVFRLNHQYYYELYYLEALNFYKKGNYQESEKYFKACKSIKSEYPDIYYYLGLIDYNSELYKESVTNFSKAIKLGYKEKQCFILLSESLKKLGDNKTAELILRSITD